MKRKLLTSTATLALIMAPMAPVFAQDSAPADKPAIIVPGDDGATATDNGSMDDDSMDTGNTVTGQAGTGSDIFFIYEADNQYRSTKLVGHAVTDSQDETLGDINDLVVSADGKLEGVIIGVGGFLGIGEKNVGVRFDALTITENPEAGDMRVTLNATRDQLESAPEFVTKEAQAAAERRQQDMQGIGGTDSGTTSALPPAAPADPGEQPAAPAQ
jgi:hypothetical protein